MFQNLYHTYTNFIDPERAFENIVGKGENAGNRHFLLFPQCLSTFLQKRFAILAKFNLSSANALNLDESNIMSFGRKLKKSFHH